ncbi:MAG: flagellar hook-associated protein FlgK [Planctomycetaceae bacterium]|nr:flagellar hook-associated protein FlgK [Planctomycetaceae bacterium]
MSLFGAINSSISGLNTATLGLQVVSNNIANANTPGFSTQTLDQVTAMAVRRGNFVVGTGVKVAGISQTGNRMLEGQLREAISDADSSQVQSSIYQQLEAVIGELGDNDISTYLSRFFNSLQEVAQKPESQPVRAFAIQQGKALTEKLNFTHSRAVELHDQVNAQIQGSVDRVNQLLDEISTLNLRVVAAQGGTGGPGVANNLIDSRRTALRELGSLIDIRVVDTEGGAINISTTGGSSLLLNGNANRIRMTYTDDASGYRRAEIEFADGESPVAISGGRMAGLQIARDYIANDFLSEMDKFANNLVYEFNKLHSSGQGLSALTSASAEHRTNDPQAALDKAGLPFKPSNGSLKVHVRDKTTGQVKTTDILIKLGGSQNTTMQSFTEELDGITGLKAVIDNQGLLQLTTDDPNAEFYFSDDTSGALAALGINSFFTGSKLGNLGVSAAIQKTPGQLSTSAGGIGRDTQTVLKLAGLEKQALPNLSGRSIRSQYELSVGDVAQRSSTAKSLADAFSQYAATLESESLSQTGVNLDEEAAKMLQYQRAYQASARVIQTANEIFDVMMQL